MKSMASGDTSWKFGDEKSNWQFIVLAIVRYLLPEMFGMGINKEKC